MFVVTVALMLSCQSSAINRTSVSAAKCHHQYHTESLNTCPFISITAAQHNDMDDKTQGAC